MQGRQAGSEKQAANMKRLFETCNTDVTSVEASSVELLWHPHMMAG
jgi:hypothetical protein